VICGHRLPADTPGGAQSLAQMSFQLASAPGPEAPDKLPLQRSPLGPTDWSTGSKRQPCNQMHQECAKCPESDHLPVRRLTGHPPS
jgi:hypothetical protein